MTETNDPSSSGGTFAVPSNLLHESRPEYKSVRQLFDQLQWPSSQPRKDFIEHRFNAFCTILGAVRSDPNNVMWTLLNKSNYDIFRYSIPYRAMRDVMNTLTDLGWLVRHGERQLHRSYRFKAPKSSPLVKLQVKNIKLTPLLYRKPIVEIRRGNTDLDKAPLDVEWMVNPKWKKWIAKHLVPRMEQLNDKLSDHDVTLFPFGKADEWGVQPQYQRIYTNISGFKEDPALRHGRIYPQNFNLPSKKNGWRQMTLIDGKPTVEVDVHASSLTLLSNDYYVGFELPATDDLYQYGPLAELNRELVKTIVQALINGVSHDRKRWPDSFYEKKAELISGRKWSDYVDPLVSVYPALKNLDSDMGMRLMLDEADTIIRAMNHLLDKGIGCLSLHDCLIVPEANTGDAKEAFYAAYESFGWCKPTLTVEG